MPDIDNLKAVTADHLAVVTWDRAATMTPPARALVYLGAIEAARRQGAGHDYVTTDEVAALTGLSTATATAHLRALAEADQFVKRYYLGEQVGERPPPTRVGYRVNVDELARAVVARVAAEELTHDERAIAAGEVPQVPAGEELPLEDRTAEPPKAARARKAAK